MNIKKKLRDLINPNYKDSDSFVRFLQKNGCTIGKGTYFFEPRNTNIDVANAHLIRIGEYCKITTGVYILAHDYSYSVLRRVYNDVPKKAALTTIGDNCFIGINSIILMGSQIGNNVIIGAGSVVSGKIPDNEVWGGNPAKFICTLDDYHKKCMSRFEKSAKTFLNEFYRAHKRKPSIQELQYFSLLFLNNDKRYNAKSEYKKMSFNGDNKEEVIRACLDYNSKYKSYEDLGINLK